MAGNFAAYVMAMNSHLLYLEELLSKSDSSSETEKIEELRDVCETWMERKKEEAARNWKNYGGADGLGRTLKICSVAQLQFPRRETNRAGNRCPVR